MRIVIKIAAVVRHESLSLFQILLVHCRRFQCYASPISNLKQRGCRINLCILYRSPNRANGPFELDEYTKKWLISGCPDTPIGIKYIYVYHRENIQYFKQSSPTWRQVCTLVYSVVVALCEPRILNVRCEDACVFMEVLTQFNTMAIWMRDHEWGERLAGNWFHGLVHFICFLFMPFAVFIDTKLP